MPFALFRAGLEARGMHAHRSQFSDARSQFSDALYGIVSGGVISETLSRHTRAALLYAFHAVFPERHGRRSKEQARWSILRASCGIPQLSPPPAHDDQENYRPAPRPPGRLASPGASALSKRRNGEGDLVHRESPQQYHRLPVPKLP